MNAVDLMAGARTVAMKPVRARLVERVVDWRWSRLATPPADADNGLIMAAPVQDRLDWIVARVAG